LHTKVCDYIWWTQL